jgi:excisionase family DNA binding protein
MSIPVSSDLTVSETCALLGVTPPTVYKLMASGQLNGYRVGNRRRITRASLEKLRSEKVPA